MGAIVGAGTEWVAQAIGAAQIVGVIATELTEARMPRLVAGSAVSGHLKTELAHRCGIATQTAEGNARNIPIAGGGSEKPARAMHAFCHALPGTWHQMSVMLSAANGLAWVKRLLGAESEAALLAQAAQLTPAQRERAPIFLPYLNGERTPHNNPHAPGVFFGLANEHDAATLAWSVIEGVSFGLLDGWHSLGVQPGEVRELSLVGGGARSPLWAQLLADLIGVPMVTRLGGEAGGALGAARLAWMADGGSVKQVCPAPPVAQRFESAVAAATTLSKRHARFACLYQAVAPEFGS